MKHFSSTLSIGWHKSCLLLKEIKEQEIDDILYLMDKYSIVCWLHAKKLNISLLLSVYIQTPTQKKKEEFFMCTQGCHVHHFGRNNMLSAMFLNSSFLVLALLWVPY